ncbi:MAG: glycoside hydrolase family 3 C-terminal domain-containing protein, partial [Spirochaetaceae bacterium]|nr:glycoside hydrolase family 3 C-terminal domain-containing protein [Spirochaetaceae bacterium]
VNEGDLDGMVFPILKTCIAMDFYKKDFKKPQLLANFPDHQRVALQTAREGVVMLKNDHALLPLKSEGSILLTGDYVEKNVKGGGAASCEGYDHATLLNSLGDFYGENLLYIKEPNQQEISKASAVILSIGTFDSEGWDHPFELAPDVEAKILKYLQWNERTVVVVNSGHGIKMTQWADKACAILYGWYGGQTGSQAISEIICGRVNPSGKLPITIERDFKDSPGYGYIPQGEKLYYDWQNEKENKRSVYDVHYDEGIFVGYRWYDKKQIEPLFPFGFGLSYSRFQYQGLELSAQRIAPGESVELSFKLKNTSERDGMETAQIYIHHQNPSVEKAVRELKAFKKIDLKAGREETVKISLSGDSFSHWDENIKAWTVEPGKYTVELASSSREIHETAELQIG